MSSLEWGVSKWDVDKESESLNKELFGAKKRSKKVAAPEILVDNKRSNIQDSDDEQFSKKAKKKMKKKLKKPKMKAEADANNVVKGSDNMQTSDNKNADDGSSPKKKRKKKRKSKTSNGSSDSFNSKEMDRPNEKFENHMKEKKSKTKDKIDNKTESSSIENKNDKERKRKRSETGSSNADNDVASKKRKTSDKIVEEKNVEKGDEGETGKKRRRRNRKKKNNSKKNKYKHLALNAQKEAEIKSDNPRDSEVSKKLLEGIDQAKVNSNPQKKDKSEKKGSLPNESISIGSSFDTSKSPSETQHSKEIMNEESKTEKKARKRNAEDKAKPKHILNKQTLISMLDGLSPDNDNGSGSSNTKRKSSEKNEKKKKKREKLENGSATVEDMAVDKEPFKGSVVSDSAKGLKEKATEKLNAGRFRFINEQLYTCKGKEALELFRQDQEAFKVYHQGFQSQTKKWPVNPLNIFIKHINNRPQQQIVADFGCGDARLSQSVRQKVHSFDLVAMNDRVTACDMSKTPLTDDSIDIAVFCLSLMGTNLNDYVLEANRVLKPGGLLKVAEVSSRFDSPERFIKHISNLGFLLLNKRELSDMFYMMDFKKVKRIKKSPANTELKLKPCVYKKR